jgi:hypothetical protein
MLFFVFVFVASTEYRVVVTTYRDNFPGVCHKTCPHYFSENTYVISSKLYNNDLYQNNMINKINQEGGVQ